MVPTVGRTLLDLSRGELTHCHSRTAAQVPARGRIWVLVILSYSSCPLFTSPGESSHEEKGEPALHFDPQRGALML